MSSWNSEGKEVDGDHRETVYRRGVSLHQFYSTSTQTTSLFTRECAAFCMQTDFAPIEETLTSAIDRPSIAEVSVGVLYHKPAPGESDEDASQPLPPAES